jgi:Periplasmic binding protein
VPYDAHTLDATTVVRRIAALKPDVLFVSAYLQDGVALRREMVRQGLRLVANIGSSSSYCMPAFGDALGKAAVGVFASDKPDGDAINASGLRPDARALLDRARTAYQGRYHQPMSAAALAGFTGAWALFTDVMPNASALTPAGVGKAALRVDIPSGGLPSGSGLRFAPPGSPDAGSNLRAQGVIWEWTRYEWRDLADRGDPAAVVRTASRRRAAIVLGVVLAGGYVATVLVVGARDLLVRRPLLDGFITPQPYNWISPPPALASSNKEPASGTFPIPFSPRTGSPAKVFTTKDSQASLALSQGSIRPPAGITSAVLAITPLAPKGFPAPGGGAVIAGNVYRFRVTQQPGGADVTRFRIPGQVVLAYPAPPARTGYHHSILYSSDGKAWTTVRGIDSPTQQLVQADANGPGYFAVGRSKETGAGAGGGRSYGNLIVTIVVVGIVAAIVAGVLVSEVRMRRRRRR